MGTLREIFVWTPSK